MKKKWIIMIVVIVVIILLAPLGIAIGTSADILNWATNDNDWIGFWSGYSGTLIGSGVTLFVLFSTLADSKKTLERTLENERNIHECNEVARFGELLVKKSADLSVNIDDMMLHGYHFASLRLKKEKYIGEYEVYLKTMWMVKSALNEMSMHLEIVKEKEIYGADTKKELEETIETILDMIGEYNMKIGEEEIDKDMEDKLLVLRRKLVKQTQDYLKEINKKVWTTFGQLNP